MKELIQKIHESPYKVVLAISGGGSEAIGKLLRHGNGSKTLLEAIVPYNQKSFEDFIHGKPDKFCSAEAARDLAMAAMKRAQKLDESPTTMGVGVTCSLFKENERENREHVIFIAIQDIFRTKTYQFKVDYNSRKKEEKFASDKIIEVLYDYFEVYHTYDNNIIDDTEAKGDFAKILFGNEKVVTFPGFWRDLYREVSLKERVILSGSFNPLHEGHLEIAKKAFELTGKAVDFEVCVHNVDKASLNYKSMSDRLSHLQTELSSSVIKGKLFADYIHFTSAPTFVEKAELFPGSQFVVGWDTFKRIGDWKYYGNSDSLKNALNRMIELKIKFLVFHRIINGNAENSLDGIPSKLLGISTICPEYLPGAALSSSEIRDNLNL